MDIAAQAAITKPFAHCSLPDLVLDFFFAARAAACSALDAAATAQFLPLLADAKATEAVMQRHPLVRGARRLVRTGTAESEHAWCSMLRSASVSDALFRVYLVCGQCCGRGRVRVCAFITRVISHLAAAAAGHGVVQNV
jgi:hypothetical protein